jgi:hypothetical protein
MESWIQGAVSDGAATQGEGDMQRTASDGTFEVTVAHNRWEPDEGQVRGVFDVYVRNDGKLVWHTDTLTVPAYGDVLDRALRDAVGFLDAYATGEYDGPVVPELAPFADVLAMLSADLDERTEA